MERLMLKFATLCFALPTALVAVGAGIDTDPTELRWLRHYQDNLGHRAYPVRIDALIGLARLGDNAAGAAPRLVRHAHEGPEFEQLLALWILARLHDGPADRVMIKERAAREKERLQKGRVAMIAARTAFLTAARAQDASPRHLDRALPKLYTAARGDDPGEALLAAWALYAIDTPVTRETAGKALKRSVAALDPEDGRYTRYLRWLRLIGPAARTHAAGRLAIIAESHDFDIDVDPKRTQTITTLAALHHPGKPGILERHHQTLFERLDDPLADTTTLNSLLIAGPQTCSPAITERLQSMHESDKGDERITRALAMCAPGPRQAGR